MKSKAFALIVTALAVPASAEGQREMDAHVHGVSSAEIAVDHGLLAINMSSPGMDIVGFEYEATSAADKDAVVSALRTLLTPENVVRLPEEAGCRLTEVLVRLHTGEQDHDHAHEEHADEDGHDHGHDHAEEDGHDHTSGAEHNEFHARYTFACDDEDALTSVEFPFFDLFENAREIEVQYVTETAAGIAELTRDAAVLTFE